jgi:hypothetical protein
VQEPTNLLLSGVSGRVARDGLLPGTIRRYEWAARDLVAFLA